MVVSTQQPVTLGLTLRRQGGTDDLLDVATDFYLGTPAAGTLIGSGIAPQLKPNDTAETATVWVAPEAGQYTIYAVIDPDDEVLENPVNNWISRTIRVVAPGLPDAPPQVDRFVVNDGAVDSLARQVVLNVTASSGALPAANPSHLLYISYMISGGLSLQGVKCIKKSLIKHDVKY